MRICVINPIVRYFDFPRHTPIGILQLLAILERDHKQAVDFQFYDANAHRIDDFRKPEGMKGLDSVLESEDFGVVAIGGLITAYNYIKAAVRRTREKQPDAKIIAGGGFFSALPTDIMGLMPDIDYGVIGEAYETFPELLAALEGRGASESQDVKGVVSRSTHGNLVFAEPRALIPDMDWLPFPAYRHAPLDIYFRYSGILMSDEAMRAKKRLDACWSLSCPFNCFFCWDLNITSNLQYVNRNGRTEPRNGRPTKNSIVRQHSASYMADYIEHLRKDFLDIPYNEQGEGVGYPVDFVAEVSENLVAHDSQTGRVWLKELRDEMWKRDLIAECVKKGVRHDASWCDGPHFGSTSHAGLVTPAVLQTLREMGFTYLDYGLEHWDRDLLRNLGKGSSPETNARAVKMTLEAGISPIPNQIVMFPDETWGTLNVMLDAWEKYGIVTVPFIMTPYPGSEMFTKHRDFILEQYHGSLDAFLSDLEDATKTTALVTHNFTPAEAVGVQSIMGASAKSRDFANARRLLKLSEKEWLKARA